MVPCTLLKLTRNIESHHEQIHVQHPIIKHEQINQIQKFSSNQNSYKNSSKTFNHQNKHKPNTCGMCGYDYSHKGICPAQGKKCLNCDRFNHFTKCCRSKQIKRNAG